MDTYEILAYYSRKDVQDALFNLAKNREVAGVFRSGSYDVRPNTLLNPKDILAMVKTGVIEFHCSLERWENPMALKPDNYESLRTGWDLILDLDCKKFEHGKLAAQGFAWALGKHGIKNFSVKFTGGKGFHIGIPWESFPKKINYKESAKLFPELPRKISLYLKDFLKERLERAFLKTWSLEELGKQVDKPLGKLLVRDNLDPYQIVEVDPVLISPRHLFRMPYSLNMNTFLVSLPVKPESLEEFEKELARSDLVKVEEKFLQGAEENEAEFLVGEALDWHAKREVEEKRKVRRMEIKRKIPQEFFPPCMKIILQGLSDGKKRSVFILMNALSSLKWSGDEIEKLLMEWNRKNRPPLRESYIMGQIRYQRGKSAKPPPNCNNPAYYESFGVCKPDGFCGGQAKTVKNPINYPFRVLKSGSRPQRSSKPE